MANLQVKRVPDDLYRKLRRHAKRQGRTLRDVVLDAVRREIARAEFHDQLIRRAPVDLGRAAARSLEEVRSEREDAS
jgi:plasmid stability protein